MIHNFGQERSKVCSDDFSFYVKWKENQRQRGGTKGWQSEEDSYLWPSSIII